jgi:hypothetical protein
MCTAEPDQRVCRVAEAEKRTSNFQVKINLRGTENGGLPQVSDGGEEDKSQRNGRSDKDARPLLPKKPDDLAPTTHENPQLPKKQLQPRKNAS